MNKANGFIVIHRQIVDWEWYGNANTLSLFIHLLLTANYEDGRFEGKVIKRGQLVTSLRSLSDETGLSIRQTRTALDHLISTGEVTNKSYTKYRIITITNYSKYQDKRQTDRQSNDKQPTNNTADNRQQYNNITNINKGTIKKESKKETASQFIPPTFEEVKKYCQERNNGIDPEYFLDYNEARGWTLKSGQKIKDWRAVMRTWEKFERGDNSGQYRSGSGKDHPGDERKGRTKYADLDASIPVF